MRFAHTNIAALDWKKLANFYITVFDCKIRLPERDCSGSWLDKGTGLTKANLKGAHLILPGYGENGPTLEIFTYEDTVEPGSIMANYKGFTHIAFQVDDVEAVLQKALDNGASRLGEVVEKKLENDGLLTFVYFRDPEDNIVEIQSWKR